MMMNAGMMVLYRYDDVDDNLTEGVLHYVPYTSVR